MDPNLKNFERRTEYIWQKYKEHLLRLEQGKETNTDFIYMVEECLGFSGKEKLELREKITLESSILVNGKKELVYRKVPEEYKEKLALFIVFYGTDHDI